MLTGNRPTASANGNFGARQARNGRQEKTTVTRRSSIGESTRPARGAPVEQRDVRGSRPTSNQKQQQQRRSTGKSARSKRGWTPKDRQTQQLEAVSAQNCGYCENTCNHTFINIDDGFRRCDFVPVSYIPADYIYIAPAPLVPPVNNYTTRLWSLEPVANSTQGQINIVQNLNAPLSTPANFANDFNFVTVATPTTCPTYPGQILLISGLTTFGPTLLPPVTPVDETVYNTLYIITGVATATNPVWTIQPLALDCFYVGDLFKVGTVGIYQIDSFDDTAPCSSWVLSYTGLKDISILAPEVIECYNPCTNACC